MFTTRLESTSGTRSEGSEERSNSKTLPAVPVLGTIQRKIAFKPEPPVSAELLRTKVRERFVAHKDLFSEKEAEYITAISNVEDQRLLDAALTRLHQSAIDYGTFDLDNAQDFVFLYYEMKKHIVLPEKAEKTDKEIEESHKNSKKAKDELDEYLDKSPDKANTYEFAFLGAGASTAYYMNTMGGIVNKGNSVVIGPVQPWRTERGPGVVNHPMHMISPSRDVVGTGNEALAPRDTFSDTVDEVVDRQAVRKDSQVTSVEKIENRSEYYYKITTDKAGVIYARKVIAGLGIGPHIIPQSKPAFPGDRKTVPQERIGKRAINMDEFQREAGNIENEEVTLGGKKASDVTVVISGANAAIDAVMTAISKGFKIIWITGSQPPKLLPGTDNETVEEEYKKVIAKQASKISAVLTYYAYTAKATSDPLKPISVETAEADIPANYYVYAMGPDTKKISGIFNKADILDKLVPTYDNNRQFGSGGLRAVIGLEVGNTEASDKTSLEIIGGSAFRMSGDIVYDDMLRQRRLLFETVSDMAGLKGRFEGTRGGIEHPVIIAEMGRVRQIAFQYSIDTLDDVINIKYFTTSAEVVVTKPAPNFDNVNFSKAGLSKKLIEIIDKYMSCIRFIQNYAQTLASYAQQVKNYLQKQEEAKIARKSFREPDPRKAGGQTDQVISSLPLNVAVADQLTPIRSQIEASKGFVPGYIRTDVNFATDSNTVLQIYISVNYPYLEDKEVDEWVDRIIRWRRPNEAEIEKYPTLTGPLPNPRNKNRENAAEFGAWFKKRLGEENEKAKLKYLASKK